MTVVSLAAMAVLFLWRPIPADDNYQVSYTAEFSADELDKPMLPAKEIRVALPSGMAVTGVRVVGITQEEIAGRFDIFPAQPPRKVGSSDEEIGFVEPDLSLYSSMQPYPSEPV